MPPNLVRVMPDSTLLPMLVNTLLQHAIIRITISCMYFFWQKYFVKIQKIFICINDSLLCCIYLSDEMLNLRKFFSRVSK